MNQEIQAYNKNPFYNEGFLDDVALSSTVESLPIYEIISTHGIVSPAYNVIHTKLIISNKNPPKYVILVMLGSVATFN